MTFFQFVITFNKLTSLKKNILTFWQLFNVSGFTVLEPPWCLTAASPLLYIMIRCVACLEVLFAFNYKL